LGNQNLENQLQGRSLGKASEEKRKRGPPGSDVGQLEAGGRCDLHGTDTTREEDQKTGPRESKQKGELTAFWRRGKATQGDVPRGNDKRGEKMRTINPAELEEAGEVQEAQTARAELKVPIWRTADFRELENSALYLCLFVRSEDLTKKE